MAVEAKTKLKVLAGGKAVPKKTPPVGKKKTAKKGRGRPAESKALYCTVLRLPVSLSVKLKRAAKTNQVSINSYVETALGVALSS